MTINPTPQNPPHVHTQDELVTLIRSLLSSWMTMETPLKAPRTKDVYAKIGITFALAAHAHRLAVVIVKLLEDNYVLESIPLVREIFEAAIYSNWIVRVNGAPFAFANQTTKEHERIINAMRNTVNLSHLPKQIRTWNLLPTSSTTSAEAFLRVCNDMVGGDEAHAHFRMLSSLSHPTSILCDFYISSDSDTFLLRKEPEQLSAPPFLELTAISLVWAGRAVEYFDKSHTRRDELRAAAKHLNISLDLKPSPASVAREFEKKKKNTSTDRAQKKTSEGAKDRKP